MEGEARTDARRRGRALVADALQRVAASHTAETTVSVVELASDVRPPDYATSFVRQATHLSGLERPISICTLERPDWLRAVVEEPGVETCELEQALGLYAPDEPDATR